MNAINQTNDALARAPGPRLGSLDDLIGMKFSDIDELEVKGDHITLRMAHDHFAGALEHLKAALVLMNLTASTAQSCVAREVAEQIQVAIHDSSIEEFIKRCDEALGERPMSIADKVREYRPIIL